MPGTPDDGSIVDNGVQRFGITTERGGAGDRSGAGVETSWQSRRLRLTYSRDGGRPQIGIGMALGALSRQRRSELPNTPITVVLNWWVDSPRQPAARELSAR